MPRPRCPRCERPLTHCLCATLPELASRTRVLILQAPGEAGHALNTGKLAALALANATRVVGEEFDPALWQDGPAYLLFPGEGAQMAGPQLDQGSSLLLVVPDATWRGARTMLARNPALAALPRLTLVEPGEGRYRVRHADLPGALSTIEAIAAALNALEASRQFDALLAPLDEMVRQQITAMGEARYQEHHVRREGSRRVKQGGDK